MANYASRLFSASGLFPSQTTTAPLFYSTREGYDAEPGTYRDHPHDEDEDEGLYLAEAVSGPGPGPGPGPAGQDATRPSGSRSHESDPPHHGDSAFATAAYGAGAAPDIQTPSEDLGDAFGPYDQDPFRSHLPPSLPSDPSSPASLPPAPLHHHHPYHDGAAGTRVPVSRAMLASQALTAMMANEAALAATTTRSPEAGPSNAGWRMYQSRSTAPERPYRDDGPDLAAGRPSDEDSSGVHGIPTPPGSPPQPRPPVDRLPVLPQLSTSVVGPPHHKLVRPAPPPEITASPPPPSSSHPEKPRPGDSRPRDRETVYLYPSEARDVGTNNHRRPSRGRSGQRARRGPTWEAVLEADELDEEANGPETAQAGPEYRDAKWLVGYMVSLGWVIYQAIWLTFWAPSPSPPSSSPSTPTRPRPRLLATIPLLVLLTTVSLVVALVALGYLVLVQRAVRHMVRGTLVGVPLALTLIGLWSWAGSFSSSVEGEETAMMRWTALGALVLAGVTARIGWVSRKRIERTVRVLELCGTVVLAHPPLIVACLAMSLVFALVTVPFLSLVYRLLILARTTALSGTAIDSGLAARACGVVFVYAWTLSTLRALQRLTISGVVASWYFNRHSPSHPDPLSLVVASLSRATGPSLGTAVQAGFWITLLDTIGTVLRQLRKVTRRAADVGRGQVGTLPFPINLGWWILGPLTRWIAPAIGFATALVGEVVGGYAVVYAGVTGVDFAESARRVGGLLTRNGTVGLADNLLVKLLLTLTSLTVSILTFFLGLWLTPLLAFPTSDPDRPTKTALDPALYPLVALCCGLVPFWTVRFVGDVVANAADTLFCCWNVDLDLGVNHSTKAQEAFGEPIPRRTPASAV